jgi:HlyD family secretion protein
MIGKGAFPFRPGMNASADIQTQTHTEVLSVPINAVTPRNMNDTLATSKPADNTTSASAAKSGDDFELVVFVIGTDNKIKQYKVKTGIQDINDIEIADGIKKGDLVVTGPYDVVSKQLKNGDKVKVVDEKDLYGKN